MAIANVSIDAQPSLNGNTAIATIDTSGANAIFVAVSSSAAQSVADSSSSTWTALTTYTSTGGGNSVTIFHSIGAALGTVGAGHQFTATSTGGFPAIVVMAFSGVNTSSAFDVQNGAGTASAQSTFQGGSVTPSEDNEVVVTAVSHISDPIVTPSGYTCDTTGLVGGVAYGIGFGYKIQTTAGAENPTWGPSAGTSDMAIANATFKAQGAGGGGGSFKRQPHRMRMGIG
jgi:hypothetical protein